MATIFYPRDLLKRAEKLQERVEKFKAKEVQILTGYIETIDRAIENWRLKSKEADLMDDTYDRGKRKTNCTRRIRMYMEERRKFMDYITEVKKQIHVVVPDFRPNRPEYSKEELGRFMEKYGMK